MLTILYTVDLWGEISVKITQVHTQNLTIHFIFGYAVSFGEHFVFGVAILLFGYAILLFRYTVFIWVYTHLHIYMQFLFGYVCTCNFYLGMHFVLILGIIMLFLFGYAI